jgi:hypothetical protein
LCWAHFATAPNDGRANLPVFWLERLPQLLDLSVTLEALPVAAAVCPAATAEPDYAIWESAGKYLWQALTYVANALF